MLSWTVLTPANAGYAPDGNGQPVWTEPNGEPEPEGSAPDWSDHDGDNLVTWLEGFYGSDPYGYDTDGDGIHDGDEVFTTQTSPTAWDTDGDGIGDLEDYYGYYSGGGDGGDSSDTSSSSDSSDTSSSSDTSDSSSSSDTSDSSDSTGGGPGFDPWDYSSDTDGDGISNGEETGVTMTDPQVVDTDGDGLTDGFELYTSASNGTLWDTDGNGVSDFDDYFFPPTGVMDSDGDGLGDYDESQLGTNPGNWDTDGDSLSDYEEVSIFLTNPLDANSLSQGRGWGALYTDWQLVDLTDSDGGGIPDRVEEHYGMNVTDSTDDLSGDLDGDGGVNVDQYNGGTDLRANVGVVYDRDSDGMSDVWELEYGFNPDDASEMGDDPDEDWITNREEYQLGLNPTLADNFFNVMERDLPEGLERGSGNQGFVDWDGDGTSNNEELLGGTDPRVEDGGGGGSTDDSSDQTDDTDSSDNSDSNFSTFTDDNDTTDNNDTSDDNDATDSTTDDSSEDSYDSDDNTSTDDTTEPELPPGFHKRHEVKPVYYISGDDVDSPAEGVMDAIKDLMNPQKSIGEAVASLVATHGTSLGAEFQVKMTCDYEIFYVDDEGEEHSVEKGTKGPKETDVYYLNQPDGLRDMREEAKGLIKEFEIEVEDRRAYHEQNSPIP
jgi:hypothetical protein